MYTIRFTGEFKRQMKLCQRRGYDIELLREVIRILSTEGKLPETYLPHRLHGDRHEQWECFGTGTHSDLFSKKYKR